MCVSVVHLCITRLSPCWLVSSHAQAVEAARARVEAASKQQLQEAQKEAAELKQQAAAAEQAVAAERHAAASLSAQVSQLQANMEAERAAKQQALDKLKQLQAQVEQLQASLQAASTAAAEPSQAAKQQQQQAMQPPATAAADDATAAETTGAAQLDVADSDAVIQLQRMGTLEPAQPDEAEDVCMEDAAPGVAAGNSEDSNTAAASAQAAASEQKQQDPIAAGAAGSPAGVESPICSIENFGSPVTGLVSVKHLARSSAGRTASVARRPASNAAGGASQVGSAAVRDPLAMQLTFSHSPGAGHVHSSPMRSSAARLSVDGEVSITLLPPVVAKPHAPVMPTREAVLALLERAGASGGLSAVSVLDEFVKSCSATKHASGAELRQHVGGLLQELVDEFSVLRRGPGSTCSSVDMMDDRTLFQIL